MRNRGCSVILSFLVCVGVLNRPVAVQSAEISAKQVLQSIELGKAYLVRAQNDDGSWSVTVEGRAPARFQVGVTSLVLLALLNSGMKTGEVTVQNGLKYLRKVHEPQPDWTYEIALMAMALEAADDGKRDFVRIQQLAAKLEASQNTKGDHRGSWGYTASGELRAQWEGDRSNAQYAILGLHAAASAGVAIKRSTWERARQHWLDNQKSDGGWNYTTNSRFENQKPTGSMTAAGIASLVICESHLHDPSQDETPDGEPLCCRMQPDNKPLEKALAWMGRHAGVGNNPGNSERILYYAYGVERAGRLSARRFFGTQDWYREWARYLVATQNKIQKIGAWEGLGAYEKDPVIGTSFALLFLSKGLSPVLVQKLMYGEPKNAQQVKTDDWNRHPSDVRRLTEHISTLPKWPKLVTWQVLNLNQALDNFKRNQNTKTANPLAEIRQAPILYISGDKAHQFSDQEALLLRAYIDQGGFILGMAGCPDNGDAFEQSFRKLITQMYPKGEGTLQPLTKDHLVFRSEYPLNPADFHLHGVDVGCRTAIMFSADDLGCLWDMYETPKPEGRSDKLARHIERDTRMGVNIVAYATGREPPNKLEADDAPVSAGEQDRIERGFLQIAKLKHTGGWDVAPRALKNLLMGLNEKVGEMATTKDKVLDAADPNIYKYPLVYMHGRTAFQISDKGVNSLREHLNRGGVLFADACCGAKPFDNSFRKLVKNLYPDAEFKRIPITHEIFSDKVFYNLSTVKRRVPEIIDPNEPLAISEKSVEPYLEGVEIDGRYVVIYSKYDISCALERQTSAACAGYIPEDALRIAINVVMYALLQNASYIETLKAKSPI